MEAGIVTMSISPRGIGKEDGQEMEMMNIASQKTDNLNLK